MKSKIILPPIGEATVYNATEKWQELCTLHNVPIAEVSGQLNELAKKFKLPKTSPVWDQIIKAFTNRKQNNVTAQHALNELKELIGKPAISDLADVMRDSQSLFIAIFASQDFDPGVYHFYGHGKEMSEDPGNLVKNIVSGDELGTLLINTANALGAAHDIIQSAGPPDNEILSSEIFVAETQRMITDLIEQNEYTKKTKIKLENFRDQVIPFLAEECIVNATYLLFSSDKRDFDNILNQIHRVMEQAHTKTHGHPLADMTLSKDVHAMKLAMALSDTRRSEIKSILRKLDSLKTILQDEGNIPQLTKLLVAAGILKKGEVIPSMVEPNHKAQEKLMKIEGFLLRLGQNVRMTAELAVRKQDYNNKHLIQDIRRGKTPESDFKQEFAAFLKTIDGPFGEASFAQALGVINNTELSTHINHAKLETMVNKENYDVIGWERHEENLMNMQRNLTGMSGADKSAMGKLIFTIAAKSPGHKVGQEVFNAMRDYRQELLRTNPNLVTSIDENIAEIKAANPDIKAPKMLTTYSSSELGTIRSSTGRGRFYSDPVISFSPRGQIIPSPHSSEAKNSTAPTPYDLGAKPTNKSGSVITQKTPILLPLVNKTIKTHKKNASDGEEKPREESESQYHGRKGKR
jgi:hypothetical protein